MNLAEDFWPILIVGGLVALALAVAFRQTGQRGFAIGAAVAVMLTLLGWLVEWAIVTERERVALTVHLAADHLRADRDAELLAMIAPDAAELRALAQAYLPRFGEAEVSISDLTVEISDAVSPPLATVETFGRITFTQPVSSEAMYNSIGPLPLVIRLQKYDDQWLLVGVRWERSPMNRKRGR